MFCYKCGKEFVSNELYCHQRGTWNRPEKKNILHSLSDERSATEYYLERGFHYDTTVQVLAKHHSTAAHKCHMTKYFSQLQKFSGFKKDSWIVKYFQFSWKLFLDLWIKPGFEIVFSIWQPFQKQFVSRIVILNIFFRFLNIFALSLFTFCKDFHVQPKSRDVHVSETQGPWFFLQETLWESLMLTCYKKLFASQQLATHTL